MNHTCTPLPFTLVPWDTDFLQALKNVVMHDTHGLPGRALIIFMHDRPRRYLTHIFQHDPAVPRPCLVPRMMTIQELFAALREEQDSARPSVHTAAGLLDQVALLSTCVHELSTPESDLCEKLAGMDEAGFFPWGVRLAGVMEECFMQGLEPTDLQHTEGEVAPFGAALLGSLGELFKRYQAALNAHDLTTPGYDAFCVSRLANRAHTAPTFSETSFTNAYTVFLAGFNTLTGTEETLFRHLWQRGARVCLHTDPALDQCFSTAPNDPLPAVHWACGQHKLLIEQFGATTELACPPKGLQPRIHFFAGYDLHSQLNALQSDLSNRHTAPSTTPAPYGTAAVALTHADALLPVLHHLPDKNCNISLGYPLERSQLFRLVELVLELRVTTPPPNAAEPEQLDGTQRSDSEGQNTHWRALIDLVRHPTIKMLECGNQSLRPVLLRMEHLLRQGGRYVSPCEVAREALNALGYHAEAARFTPKARTQEQQLLATPAPLLEWLVWHTVDVWQNVHTPADMARALSELCETLLVCGGGIWKRFPLDAESLFRLMQRIVPALADNLMAHTPLPWPLLKTMLKELIHAERVPFEADPLTGLQVLGMLETRLLQFSQVFIVDATDDHLPGAPARSPLMPDSLRAVLGLPDTRHRDDLAAYTVYRLIAGADDVYIYWQEGVEPSGLFDGKKQRSRFIEELVWQEEQKQKSILKPGTPPLRVASPTLIPPRRARRTVERSAAIQKQVDAFLRKPLFSTALDSYLSCPLRFYFEHICGLRTVEEVTEDDDPAAVGIVLHSVLKSFYEPLLNQTIQRADLSEDRLIALFHEQVTSSNLCAALPPESAAMLRVAGPERLARFLRHQPETTCVRHLEARFNVPLTVGSTSHTLAGILDRVDEREHGSIILDYKTGRLKTVPTQFWQSDLWPKLKTVLTGDADQYIIDPNQDILPNLAQHVPTVQLPWYIYLYGQASHEPVFDAAFVELATDGQEAPLLGNGGKKGHNVPKEKQYSTTPSGTDGEDAKNNDARNELILHNIPVLLRFLVHHLTSCPSFRPQEGKQCDWCLWKNLCMI